MSCIGSCFAGAIAVSQARFPLSSSDLAPFSLAVSAFLLFGVAAVEVLVMACKSRQTMAARERVANDVDVVKARWWSKALPFPGTLG